ncbi:family 10 glycosylhydrolase [Heyndrickxia oleronia]|uniref:glycoside hydrolase family 10 protein n=1 Tax=Heyndrickxia oleronia TaxID=38875 RepID=UPI0020424985|nr:glycoside hydrolase family 10 protein [Heyndrickxia oleronia]MCM3239781.1 family 10 glycosylhydrolase [Heyndrickxia oleronia]
MMMKKSGFALVATILLVALFPSKSIEAKEVISPKREFRAVWIATVNNIDWPSKKGLSIKKQKEEYMKLLNDVKDMGMNAVIVQIKPTADAFYPSNYGPWSEYLTGTQGKNPGYNPLEFMIQEAHKRNLEFHAWFNPYRISMNHKDIKKLSKDHPARKHPDWVLSYGKQLYYDPGIPEVQDFIVDGIMEVVKNYDIDGVHMDDYFYPYKIAGVEFPDNRSYKSYGSKQFANKGDWRRDNVNKLVAKINTSIKNEKSYVKFGISPFGVWRNIADDPSGSNTKAGQTNYDDLYADTRQWIQNGSLDYINPQIYWSIGYKPASFDVLNAWWRKEIAGKPIHLYIGQAAYKINNNTDPAWSNSQEYSKQINLMRNYKDIHGSVHFSLKNLIRNPLGIKNRLMNDLYKSPALIPAMPWLDDTAPKMPKLRNGVHQRSGVQLTVEDQKGNDTAYYAVYRFDGKQKGSINSSKYLLMTVRKTSEIQVILDKTAKLNKTYTYVVTALDRLHNESVESNIITVK